MKINAHWKPGSKLLSCLCSKTLLRLHPPLLLLWSTVSKHKALGSADLLYQINAPTWWLNVASWLSCLSQSGDTRPWGCPSTGEVGVSEGWCVLLAWLSPQEQAATSPQTAWVVAAAAGEVLTQYRLPWGAHFWLQVRNRLLFQNTDSSPPTLHCPGGCQGQSGRRCTAPVSN